MYRKWFIFLLYLSHLLVHRHDVLRDTLVVYLSLLLHILIVANVLNPYPDSLFPKLERIGVGSFQKGRMAKGYCTYVDIFSYYKIVEIPMYVRYVYVAIFRFTKITRKKSCHILIKQILTNMYLTIRKIWQNFNASNAFTEFSTCVFFYVFMLAIIKFWTSFPQHTL